MELKLRTEQLQEMVSKASKCVSNNKLIPLTSLMNIKVVDGVLTLVTTDASNYLYVKENIGDCDNFEVSVNADLFIKLVQKTTSPSIELIFKDDTFTVKGNGKYVMDLPLDENGNIIRFPVKYKADEIRDDGGIIKAVSIKNILNSNKPSLAISVELPSLTSYYCGDKVVTSDSYKVCSTNLKLFTKPLLVTSNLMDILGILSGEDIQVSLSDEDMLFTTDKEVVYAPIEQGIETFPIDAINDLVANEFSSSCRVSKLAVVNTLNRLSLFVSPYDKKCIYLTFTPEGILFNSKQSSGSELVPYVDKCDFSDYTCCIDIEMLKSQVNTISSETLNLFYGSDIAIKLVDDKVVQIIALMTDDRMDGDN